MKKPRETAESLKTAINIRHEYAHLGLIESHDMLQQMLNLSNMLVLSKENEMALQVLSTYETLVLEYEGSHSFDYGVCELMHGVIALSAGNATEAENRLLSAESIIGDTMGYDNDYMQSVYRYLHNLYARRQKPEQALEYKKSIWQYVIDYLKEKILKIHLHFNYVLNIQKAAHFANVKWSFFIELKDINKPIKCFLPLFRPLIDTGTF